MSQEPSRSAGIIAAHRALESAKPSDERVCNDPYASDFCPKGFTVIGKSDIPEPAALEIFNGLVPGFHDYFIARSRYIDDSLASSIDEGLEQLVILGAGYDSRAYRFDLAVRNIPVFEVDRPATQEAKKTRVKELFSALPGHVSYVPVDFQHDSLESRLNENRFDNNLKTLFIWEGVTMYINQKAVDDTLGFIAGNSAPGSSVILDFTLPEVIQGTHESKEAKAWRDIASRSEEPLVFGIAADSVESFFKTRGFRQVSCHTHDYFKTAYFTGKSTLRKATPILAIARAWL